MSSRMKETMTLEQLKEYIRDMPEDEILKITFEEDEEDGGDHDIPGDGAV